MWVLKTTYVLIIVNKYKQYDFNNDYRVLLKLLDNNEYVLFLANYMAKPHMITVPFADLGIPYSSKMALDLHDVYTGEKFWTARDFVDINVASHDCAMGCSLFCRKMRQERK